MRPAPRTWRRTWRRTWSAALGTALLPLAAWAVVRVLGLESGYPWMPLLAFTPYAAVGSVLVLLAAALTGRWRHAAVAGLVALSLAACVVGRAVPAGDDGAGAAGAVGAAGQEPARTPAGRVRVATLNLLAGLADARAVVRLVRQQDVGLLAVQELTETSLRELDAAGLAALLPYRAAYPARTPGSGTGSALFSRYPLAEAGLRVLPSSLTQAQAVMAVPGSAPVFVESVHPDAPVNGPGARRWADDLAALPPASRAGRVRVLLGDFNSTLDHAGLRALIATGYRDAADATGTGLEPTWPFRFHRNLPPVTLDHVLADRRVGIVAASVQPVAGSDHRALVVELRLPPGALGDEGLV